jgi:uncharacterized damage-inducible protein DinB
MSTPPMLRQMRHDVWANEKLIDHCRRLTKDQLELTVPGTYGSVRATLIHIVAADLRYLRRLGLIPDALFDEDRNEDAGLDEIAEQLQRVKDGVEKLFSDTDFDPNRVIRDAKRRNPADPPMLIASWVLLNQFAHHGSDHRAQIGTILGSHGLESADIDVWAYGRELDAVKEETTSRVPA